MLCISATERLKQDPGGGEGERREERQKKIGFKQPVYQGGEAEMQEAWMLQTCAAEAGATRGRLTWGRCLARPPGSPEEPRP